MLIMMRCGAGGIVLLLLWAALDVCSCQSSWSTSTSLVSFSPRLGGHMMFMPPPFTYANNSANITINTAVLLVNGGYMLEGAVPVVDNAVWLSSAGGLSWTIISGTDDAAHASAADGQSFTPFVRSFVAPLLSANRTSKFECFAVTFSLANYLHIYTFISR